MSRSATPPPIPQWPPAVYIRSRTPPAPEQTDDPSSVSSAPVAGPSAPPPDDDAWKQPTYGPQLRRRRPIKFTKASLAVDEYGVPVGGGAAKPGLGSEGGKDKVQMARGFYAALLGEEREAEAGPSSRASPPPSRSAPPPRRSHSLRPSASRRSDPTWFITRSLASSAPTTRTNTPPSLADLIASDPPPLPGTERYEPPPWLALGPGNRGYAMLAGQGWTEGEGLGRGARPRECVVKREQEKGGGRGKGKEREVVDLTGDSDEEGEEDVKPTFHRSDSPISLGSSRSPTPPDSIFRPTAPSPAAASANLPPSERPRVTPIAVHLKADRLGIGLKASSKKRKQITYTAAEVREIECERARRQRHEDGLGKGWRRHARIEKREREERLALMAELK